MGFGTSTMEFLVGADLTAKGDTTMKKWLALLFILALAMLASAAPLPDQTPARPTKANVGVPRRRGTHPRRPKKSTKSTKPKADLGVAHAPQMPVIGAKGAQGTKPTAARQKNNQPREAAPKLRNPEGASKRNPAKPRPIKKRRK
jgi:hypothetical protein